MSKKAVRKEQAIKKAKRKKILIISICALVVIAILTVVGFTIYHSFQDDSLNNDTDYEHVHDEYCDH